MFVGPDHDNHNKEINHRACLGNYSWWGLFHPLLLINWNNSCLNENRADRLIHSLTSSSLQPFTRSSITSNTGWINRYSAEELGQMCPDWFIITTRAFTVHDEFESRWLSGDNRGKNRQQDKIIHPPPRCSVSACWFGCFWSSCSLIWSLMTLLPGSAASQIRASRETVLLPGPVSSVCLTGLLWRVKSGGIRLHLGNQEGGKTKSWKERGGVEVQESHTELWEWREMTETRWFGLKILTCGAAHVIPVAVKGNFTPDTTFKGSSCYVLKALKTKYEIKIWKSHL